MTNDKKIDLTLEMALFALSTDCDSPVNLDPKGEGQQVFGDNLDVFLKSIYKSMSNLEAMSED